MQTYLNDQIRFWKIKAKFMIKHWYGKRRKQKVKKKESRKESEVTGFFGFYPRLDENNKGKKGNFKGTESN